MSLVYEPVYTACFKTGNSVSDSMAPSGHENLIFIDSRVIDCSKLMPMEEFVKKLFEDGGTFTALTTLCEDNEVDFGTPLYWMHGYLQDGQGAENDSGGVLS